MFRIFGNNDPNYTRIGLDKLTSAIKDTSAADIKARDRVDISLEEYEYMKKRIADLEWENSQHKRFASILKIDPKIIEHCDKYSVEVAYCENIRDYERTYDIRFKISYEELRRAGLL